MMPWLEALTHALPVETLLRLSVAIVAGGALGLEREKHDKPAGLRTHMLVSLGAASFMIGSMEFAAAMGDAGAAIRIDPMRALAGVIGGVGFLGAGSIIQSRGAVHGITTAASIWVSAAIGASCGMGLYRLAVTSGLMALVVLWGIGFVEKRVLGTKDRPKLP